MADKITLDDLLKEIDYLKLEIQKLKNLIGVDISDKAKDNRKKLKLKENKLIT